jgi:hypothetical protein
MKDEVTINTIRVLRSRNELMAFAGRLADWLKQDKDGGVTSFTESRAKALLRASNLTDDATLNDFARQMEQDASLRVALYDLLQESELGNEADVGGLAQLSAAAATSESRSLSWLALIIAAYAWRSGYPLQQLDPASPPGQHTPAGQLLRRAAQFLRRQVQRSATERDKLDRQLSQPPSGAPALDELAPSLEPVAPLPPHYRPPIPESYPEMTAETLQLDPAEAVEPLSVTLGDPLVISADEVGGESGTSSEPVRMPPITIERDQVAAPSSSTSNAASGAPPSPMPASAVVMPSSPAATQSRPSLTMSLRQMFRQEELTSTKLRVIVQHYPDGPGLYGLQVRVSCKGVKSYVAGTTDRDGKFACELPVRAQSGLTYDVDVTWPREEGGETERKSIPLHADRTHFVLPFYRLLNPPDEG